MSTYLNLLVAKKQFHIISTIDEKLDYFTNGGRKNILTTIKENCIYFTNGASYT